LAIVLTLLIPRFCLFIYPRFCQ